MKLATQFKNHWQLLLITICIFVFWNLWVIFPLKMLVVFLHETSHALAALLTGGKVERITLSIYQGGTTTTRGGNFFVIASAGYVGSLIFGVFLFVIALRFHIDRLVVGILGALMLVIAAIYMREAFALVFTILMGVILLASAKFLAIKVNDLILRVIGLTSMIYVPYDIVTDTLLGSRQMSDARIIATNYGGPTIFWGILWLIISLVTIAAVFRYGLKGRSNLALK